MSTDKLNIYNMGIGHDARRDSMVRKGYGDLLDIYPKGRKEMTIDTASMYKKAADQGAILGAGVGGAVGGIGGAEIAEAMGGSATAKLLGALVGAGVGGVGGYYAGGALDKADEGTGRSSSDKYTSTIGTVGGGALGALTGYGVSKYLLGSKNKTHHVISALLGGGIGAGAGYIASGGIRAEKNMEAGFRRAAAKGYTGEKARKYAEAYSRRASENQNNTESRGILGGILGDTYEYVFEKGIENADEYADAVANDEDTSRFNWSALATAEAIASPLEYALYRKWIKNKTQYRQLVKNIKSKQDNLNRLGLKITGTKGRPSYTKLTGKEVEGTYAALNDMASRGKFISNAALADFEHAVNSVLDNSTNPLNRASALRQIRAMYPDLFKQLDGIRLGKGFMQAMKAAPLKTTGTGLKRFGRSLWSLLRW